MPAKRDFWVVRDESGMLHAAQLLRQYSDEDEDMLLAVQISTACAPVVKRYELPVPHHCLRVDDIPSIHHGGFTIVTWRVREAPTCLACVVVAEAFK
jgi:hypothetical protein